jgi:hypothetical protein
MNADRSRDLEASPDGAFPSHGMKASEAIASNRIRQAGRLPEPVRIG